MKNHDFRPIFSCTSKMTRNRAIWNANRKPYPSFQMVPFSMILSDLEWLSEIFNDMKHRAVSLRQLSFLFSVLHLCCTVLFWSWHVIAWQQHIFNPLIATLKPHSNGPSYSNIVIGTLDVDWWAVTFGTARRELGGAVAPQAHPCCTKCNSPPINGQCTNFVLFDVPL